MIPRLTLNQSINDLTAHFLTTLAKTKFSGEIRADLASRLLASTDNSIYQILPQSVIFPRNAEDISLILQLASQEVFKPLTFSPRGGGTGTNGQSLSNGMIIDCSKYMNHILEVNLEQGWVKVQPGVILDQLNDYLRPFGVFFAPSLAPSNRATLGGMINTDACGKGSRIYGRTSDHLLELAWVLADGTMGRSHPLTLAQLSTQKRQSGRWGDICRQIDDIVTSKADLIAAVFPNLTRFMTGYNLAKVYDAQQQTFDINRILAGSEGTLAIITEASLKLTSIPQAKQLLVIHYPSFDDALQDAQRLLESDPTAIETIDETILGLAKEDIIYNQVKEFIDCANALNLVEFTAETPEKLQQKLISLLHRLETESPKRATGYYLTQNITEIAQLWELRKKGVGLLGNLSGNRKPIAFIEDTAVCPSQLASYIQEFKALLDRYHLNYAMYGHVDVGCVHVRPALDLKLPQDESMIQPLSDEVVTLVRNYGGVMWGEHGKGFRSEYTSVFFGEELYQDLRRIKHAFDPENKLNPGKIVTPYGQPSKVVSVNSPLKGQHDRQVLPTLHDKHESAFNCNGNGACFDFHPDTVMCPSAKETRDRIHSPKGRATVMREWLRQVSLTKTKNLEQSGNFWLKTWYILHKWRGNKDYSHQVYEAMHGCLSCQACVSQCPIHVNIPDLKAKFLHLYHTRYLRPPRDYFLAYSEIFAQWQSYLPLLINPLLKSPLAHFFLKQGLKIADPPLVSFPTLRQGLKKRGASVFNFEELLELEEEKRANSVILIQDAFTSFYEAQLVLDVYDFLTKIGYQVYIPPFVASGKPLLVKGFLKQFDQIIEKNKDFWQKLQALNIPLVGIEPSIVLTYQQEYGMQNVIDIQLLQDFLLTNAQRLPRVTSELVKSSPYYLLGHCIEKTTKINSQQQWQQIFQIMGLSLSLVPSGCCGMAGIYGHESEHYKASYGIYQASWLKSLPKNFQNTSYYLATGFSCRFQVQRFSQWTPRHPIEVLLSHLVTKL